MVGQDAAAQQVREKIAPVDAGSDRLGLLGALAETRKAVVAARTQLQGFDGNLGQALAGAGDQRESVQKMRDSSRDAIGTLGKVLENLDELSRRAQRERGADELARIEEDRREVLADLSMLLSGTSERPTSGLLIGGAQWEEGLFELQEAGRTDLVEPLNKTLWELKRDPALWALVQPRS